MVDIHSHILYGILDSPQSIDVSIEIAKQYIDNGFTHVVSTPHFDPTSNNVDEFKSECDRKYGELDKLLYQQGLSLNIISGAEVMISPKLMEINNINYLCIKNTNYMLLEFPWGHFPLWVDSILFELGLKNIVPILAHPERNEEIFKNYEKFLKLIDSGLLTQINAISLFNGGTRNRIKRLFNDNAITFLATDTHRPDDDRMVCFSKAILMLKRKYGMMKAERIVENSASVIVNKYI